VSHVVVDGGGADSSAPPPQNGPRLRCSPTASDLCLGLIEVGGNAKNQRVEWVEARNTRGFSTLLCREGGTKGPSVSHNQFVPNPSIGDHWPYEQSTQVADGISISCTNAKITDNTVIDPTDAGIALYSPAGTLLANNSVIAKSRATIFGIALVDPAPHMGDARGVIVRDNVVDAQGGLVANGIAIGPRVSCYVRAGEQSFDVGDGPQPDSISGATVTGNVLRGTHMGYGIVISGARGVTVTGNRDKSMHAGTPWPEILPAGPSQSSFTCPQPDPPSGFQYDPEHVSGGKLQKDFRPGQVQGVGNLCIPGDLNGDGRVDGADVQRLQVMLQGGTQEPCRADLNRDGVINGADLTILQQRASMSSP
jgi:parallel beta-helix repeat protein